MKSAVIGVGMIGNVHIRIMKELGAELVAVCDVDKNKIASMAGVQVFTDYIKMLDQVKPDVVHICTPHHLHAEMIIAALKRDINVLCEKPLCIREEDIPKILEAEENSKAQLGVCHQNRYNSENVFLKEYLKDKKVVCGYGSMFWHRDAEYYSQGDWRGKWLTEGGGVLINQALHTIDLLQWFVGYPNQVSAELCNHSLKGVIETEDTATLFCSDGGNFTFFATNACDYTFPVNVVVQTETELINVLSEKVVAGNTVYNFEKDKIVYGKSCYGEGHKSLIKDFYDCIETGRKFEIDGQEAAKVVKIILAAYKNAKSKLLD